MSQSPSESCVAQSRGATEPCTWCGVKPLLLLLFHGTAMPWVGQELGIKDKFHIGPPEIHLREGHKDNVICAHDSITRHRHRTVLGEVHLWDIEAASQGLRAEEMPVGDGFCKGHQWPNPICTVQSLNSWGVHPLMTLWLLLFFQHSLSLVSMTRLSSGSPLGPSQPLLFFICLLTSSLHTGVLFPY
jgi:hypothetical protein